MDARLKSLLRSSAQRRIPRPVVGEHKKQQRQANVNDVLVRWVDRLGEDKTLDAVCGAAPQNSRAV